jgi:hypothetical protein
MGCDTTSLTEWLPTALASFFEGQHLPWERQAGATHLATQRHMQEDRNPHSHRCENPKTRNALNSI